MDETVQNTDVQSATSEQTEQTQELNSETATPPAPQDGTGTDEETARADEGEAVAESAEEQPPAPFVSFDYNHERVDMTEDEAVEALQIGMHFSRSLEYLAALAGTTPRDYLINQIEQTENSYRLELEEEFGEGDPRVEKLLKLRKMENQEIYEKYKQDRASEKQKQIESVNSRLAGEFEKLQKMFPELTAVKDIPDSVLQSAVKEDIPLELSYLRYLRTEDKKIKEEQAAADTAAKASTGSVKSAESKTDETFDNFMRGLWGK